MDDATFLYPAKAAAGPCARLAQCGGRGFRMRARRLVVYYFYIISRYKFVLYKYKILFYYITSIIPITFLL